MMRDDAVRTEAPRVLKWKALVGLIVLWVAAVTQATWVFAVLFVWWALLDMYYGETHFIESVPRRSNPITFWLIVVSWLALSVLWIIYD